MSYYFYWMFWELSKLVFGSFLLQFGVPTYTVFAIALLIGIYSFVEFKYGESITKYVNKYKKNPINKGKVWYNNGSDNFRLDPLDPIISNQNLVKGRLSFGMVRSEHTCPHCGKVGKGPNMKGYHFDKCKEKK